MNNNSQNQNLHALKYVNLEVSFHFIQKGAVLNLQECKMKIYIEKYKLSDIHILDNLIFSKKK